MPEQEFYGIRAASAVDALSIAAALVNVVLSIALVQRVGAVGVIAGTVLSYLFVLIGPQTWVVRNTCRRELRADQTLARRPRAQLAASVAPLE